MSTYLNTLETLGLNVNTVLQEMEELFPPLTPHPSQSLNDIMYKAGQRSVVEWLQQRLEQI